MTKKGEQAEDHIDTSIPSISSDIQHPCKLTKGTSEHCVGHFDIFDT